MLEIASNLEKSFTRDEIVNYARNKIEHDVDDNGMVSLYIPFISNDANDGKKKPIDVLKKQFTESDNTIIGFDDPVVYTGSLGFGKVHQITYAGSKVPQVIWKLQLKIQDYNKLVQTSRLIKQVNSVKKPTEQFVEDVYNMDTLYNELGILNHIINVVEINWNTLDSRNIKYTLSYLRDSIGMEMSEKQKIHIEEKIRTIESLYP